MKSVFFCLVISLFVVITNVQGANPKMANATLKGVVTDVKTGETLAGVKVNIEGTNLVTYTNFDGEFEFTTLPEGTYRVNVQMVSYTETKTEVVATKRSGRKKQVQVLLQPISNLSYYKKSNG